MALLRRLKAWGAVERNGRRLHLINSSVVLGLPLGFGFLDALLPWLQHRHPVPVLAAACALQWINVLTVHFMPAHIRDYVAWHCATSEISIPTIARIYAMLKITLTFIASIIVDLVYTVLIFSGNKLYIRNLYADIKINLDKFFVDNGKKLIVKTIFVIIPGISIIIFACFYIIFYTGNLNRFDFAINFFFTCGLWFCMTIIPTIIRIIYLSKTIIYSNDSTKQREMDYEWNSDRK